jgi:SecD/SecF fusion protein
MEAKKRWHFWLIIAVLILTVYNILPTIFFYTKPLKSPIDQARANTIASTIANRVNELEEFSIEWLQSFCELIHVDPKKISLDENQPESIKISFVKETDAQIFSRYFPRAGNLISFTPAQLTLSPASSSSELTGTTLTIRRKIPVHIDAKKISEFYQFSTMYNKDGTPSPLYKALIEDRATQLAIGIGGVSESAKMAKAIIEHPQDPQIVELATILGQRLTDVSRIFGNDSPISARFYEAVGQGISVDGSKISNQLLSSISSIKDRIRIEKIGLQKEESAEGDSFDKNKKQHLNLLVNRENCLTEFESLLKRHSSSFQNSLSPLDYELVHQTLAQSASKQEIVFGNRNPVIERMVIDWANSRFLIKIHPDLVAFKKTLQQKNASQYLRDQVDQIIYNQIALVAQFSSEKISPTQDQFTISLKEANSASSFLAMRLSSIARNETSSLKALIENSWHPSYLDLKKESFPVWDQDSYSSLSQNAKDFGLLIYSPAASNRLPMEGMRMNSIYVIARGLDKMIATMQNNPESEINKQFFQDVEALRALMQQQGFYGYSGKASYVHPEFANDYIFEMEDYYQDVLKATRENFLTKGTKRFATLEFSDVEQRILAENAIDDSIHEDLLKWRDDYRAASLGIKGMFAFDVPKPTENIFWSNLKLSFIKFFRGDDRKILHWGLDLSGGKTVQIELRDVNNHVVTKEADLKQGINELYSRVNKMGVSEVSIRQEGHTIALDFPGSQSFSAAELVKASTMYFHVVNETFSQGNIALAAYVEQFLQDVWNEAVVTNRKSAEEINAIAWRHIHGDSLDPEVIQPRSLAARILHEQGLRLASPQDPFSLSILNDQVSKLAILRGNTFLDWNGRSHPLLVVFRNFALEGSNLDNVTASYDPAKGNFITFNVKGFSKNNSSTNPRDDFEAWTSQFCKEKIAGTPLAEVSRGEGWRMAVILNETVISAPTLASSLRNSASITGNFTQRETNQLEADLQAGSLSFSPKILSEKNVSPEIGGHERHLGILGMLLAISLVIITMISYYRFGGMIASIAVLFNLVIMWAALQNIQATMTLASIAGIILTLGMAVDANVLVFERVREEFAATGKIAVAMHAGYRKAFSAIFDSNITTLIAAVILLNFDSGPIKGLAITLIIGLVSSMFTALFMTRFFFFRWVQNPANKTLKMANLFKFKKIDFLKYTKTTLILSAAVILIGGFVAINQRHTLLGMDFTGGYVLNIDIQSQSSINYRETAEKALLGHGASSQEIQVRELSPSNQLRIFLASSMEQAGHPFYNMPLEGSDKDPPYPFATNPRIAWVVDALASQGLSLNPDSLPTLEQNWSSVSGQMSDTMRNQAFIGLALALVCILVYITIRFEFSYAASATICLLHDVIFTIGVMSLLHWLGVPVQLDMHTVAALMTIVGYSLNDTIIVFDRIREDMRLMRKHSINDIINHAINVTLSRTLMTSGTTLLVLFPLILLGGSTIFSFALVMAIGVLFGTLSSLFIAAPLMLYFHRRESEKQKMLARVES